MISMIVRRINDELTDGFNKVDTWFSIGDDLLNYNPKDGGWNVRKILEHISLTNHFLLILIRKGTKKAVALSAKNDYSNLIINYDLDWVKLEQIGEHKSFEWKRPGHMEPAGTANLAAIRNILQEQLEECRNYLNQLKNGEGILCKTMMTVNGLGKMDVYHYIYFLVQHAKRHLMQMEKTKMEFENI